jgi:hypothetical protein
MWSFLGKGDVETPHESEVGHVRVLLLPGKVDLSINNKSSSDLTLKLHCATLITWHNIASNDKKLCIQDENKQGIILVLLPG